MVQVVLIDAGQIPITEDAFKIDEFKQNASSGENGTAFRHFDISNTPISKGKGSMQVSRYMFGQ